MISPDTFNLKSDQDAACIDQKHQEIIKIWDTKRADERVYVG